MLEENLMSFMWDYYGRMSKKLCEVDRKGRHTNILKQTHKYFKADTTNILKQTHKYFKAEDSNCSSIANDSIEIEIQGVFEKAIFLNSFRCISVRYISFCHTMTG